MARFSKGLVEVGISMVLQDGFTQQAGKISSSYATLLNDMNTWNRAVTQSAGAAFDYGTRLVGGMYEAYKYSAGVYNQIFMTSKIAGATVEQSKNLMEIAKRVNMEVPLTSLDIASGERFLAMAGNSADAIEKMIEPAAKLASLFDMQLGGKGGVADLMTNIMATFNIASQDAKQTADILAVATTSANMNLTDLAQALQYSGSTFRNAGIDLNTAASAIGVLGDQGIQASSAGTALANMLRYLTLSITGQKTKGTSMLKAMGISKEELVDANGNLKDLSTLMTVLAIKMGKLSGTAREAAMYNIFGVRGQRASSALFQALWNGTDKMNKILDKTRSSSGFLEETYAERKNTPQGRVDALNASIENLKVSLGQVMTVFNPIIRGLSEAANWLSNHVVTGAGAWIVKLTTCATISMALVAGIRLLAGAWRMVVTMGGAYVTATKASSTAMSGMNTQAAILEAHLRTIVALMIEYTALLTVPSGTKGMMLPMGGRVGRNKAGKVYVTGVGRGRRVSSSTYANEMAGKFGTATQNVGNATQSVKNVSRMAGAGGMILSFMGGPWGVGLALGMTALSLGLDYWGNKLEDNSEAVRENTSKLSAQEAMDKYQERYVEAMEQAAKSLSNGTTVKLTVNGVPIGSTMDGGELSVDANTFYY